MAAFNGTTRKAPVNFNLWGWWGEGGGKKKVSSKKRKQCFLTRVLISVVGCGRAPLKYVPLKTVARSPAVWRLGGSCHLHSTRTRNSNANPSRKLDCLKAVICGGGSRVRK